MAARTHISRLARLGAVFSVLILGPLVAGNPSASGVVNGGTPVAQPGSWPWMVGIVIESGGVPRATCSGALIGPTTVLTAAHCVDSGELGFTPTANDFMITSARNLTTTPLPGGYVSAISLAENPAFSVSHIQDGHDEAVLQLSAAPAGAVPITVLQPIDVGPYTTQFSALVAGYGLTVPGNQASAGALYQTAIPNAIYGPSVIAATASPSYTCYGDSGSPLIVNLDGGNVVVDPSTSNGSWAVIGVTSYGDQNCAFSDAFTNATADFSFIAANDPYLASGPLNAVAPTISGSPFVGSMLACNPGSWQPGTVLSYQWFRTSTSGGPIQGATSSTYTPAQSDLSTAIACEVHAELAGATVSADSSAVTISATVPGAPTISSVSSGNRVATVSFAPPASDGGSAVTSFTVTASPGGANYSGATSPIVVRRLANGKHYSFTVSASNLLGMGAMSQPSAAVMPRAPRKASLVLRSTRLRSDRGAIAIAMTCKNARCSGSIRLMAPVAIRVRNGLTTKLVAKTEVLAATAIGIGKNASKTVVMRLNALGTTALAHVATHAVRATILVDVAGRSSSVPVTIT